MSKRRKNELPPLDGQKALKLFKEDVPRFEEAEKLFYANEKARNILKRTIEWHRENLHVFKKAMREQGIELNLEKITYRTIRNNLVLYALDKWGNKPQTINMRIRTLRQFFGFLISEGYLAENPAARVELLKTAKTLIVALSDEQVRRLLAVPDRKTFTGLRDFTIMSLLLDTGLRLSEVTGLLLSDLNFSESHIKIRGKGAKERLVPMQPKLKKVLKQYLIHRGSDIDNDSVFLTIDNTRISNRGLQERFEKISAKAGVNEVRTSPHTWRHTFARLYILNGGDAFSLKQILGHSSFETVNRYVNLFGSDVKSQHRKASPLENLHDD